MDLLDISNGGRAMACHVRNINSSIPVCCEEMTAREKMPYQVEIFTRRSFVLSYSRLANQRMDGFLAV